MSSPFPPPSIGATSPVVHDEPLPPPSRSRRPLIAAVGAVVALVIVLAVVMVVRGGDDEPRTITFTERWDASLRSFDLDEDADLVVVWADREVTVFGSVRGSRDHDVLFALAADTGDVLWELEVAPAREPPRAELVDDVLVVAAWDDDTEFESDRAEGTGTLLALDPRTGDERWRRDEVAAMREAPVVVGDAVLVMAQRERGVGDVGEIVLVDASTGDETMSTGRESRDIAVELVAARQDMFVVRRWELGGDPVLMAYGADGEERWSRDLDAFIPFFRSDIATQVDGEVIVLLTRDGITGVDADDGTERWVAGRLAPQFLIDHDHGIVASCGFSRVGIEVTMIDLADGDELWVYDEPGGSFVGLAGGRAYITADTSASSPCQYDEDVASGHDLLAFDARTGDEIWSIGGEDQEVGVSYGRDVFSDVPVGPIHWIALVDETSSEPVSSLIDATDGSTIASSTWDRDDEYRAVIGFDGVPVGLLQRDDGLSVFDPADDVRRFDFGTDAQLIGYAYGTLYVLDDGRLTAIG